MRRLIAKQASWCAALIALCLAGTASASQLTGTVELAAVPLDDTQAPTSLALFGMSGSVLGPDTLAFEGGYDPAGWSGILRAASLQADGTRKDLLWDAGAILTDASATPPDRRVVLTAGMHAGGAITGMAFRPAAAFDAWQRAGLMSPPPGDAEADTLAIRVDYLRGARMAEQGGTLRVRKSVLGAIVHSQSLYVASPVAHYADSWPSKVHDSAVPAPEMAADAEPYASFVQRHAQRPPVLYIGANDGMLHAFHAPSVRCHADAACQVPPGAGRELWAYVPRAVYPQLGNLTHGDEFRPTVDATPVMRDVFFGQHGRHEWHSLLVGGLRLGGRGVYALDITDPAATSEAFPARTVLWEFDADLAASVSASSGTDYDPADLGYTYGQPAIARLSLGRWAVLVPSGYFPDCEHAGVSHCDQAATPPPSHDSALFVLDAQTGDVIRELKTPSAPEGAASYGLATPVLGDYDNDQVDDIAFAGDLAGNLWRFDLSAPDPRDWQVSLAYRPPIADIQPITVMPRLFPDPGSDRFIVVFGTGRYLGAGDRTDGIAVQSVYGIRDKVDGQGRPLTVARASLRAQKLSQANQAGTTLRTLSSHPIPSSAGGWYFDLDVMAGERVVSTPSALFNTNTVLIGTLIPSAHAQAPPRGAVLAVDAATGGPGSDLWSGGAAYAGAMVMGTRDSGTLSVAAKPGGGSLLLPGLRLPSAAGGLGLPPTMASTLWRRRSWLALKPGD